MYVLGSLFLFLVGCSGCGGPRVEEAPSDVGLAEPLPEPEPELMAEQAVPTHADLGLAGLESADDPMAWVPKGAVGDWSLTRTWASQKGRDWRPIGVGVLWVSETGPRTVDQLKAEGEQMTPFASRKYDAVGPAWGVVAAKQSGQPEFATLKTAELLVAPEGTSFHSPWVGQMVTVDVKGVQKVTVPAGTFDALWVQRAWAQGKRSTLEDSWWNPERGLVAQVVRVQTRDMPEARMTVLVEYGNALEPQVTRQVWADGLEAMGLGED